MIDLRTTGRVRMKTKGPLPMVPIHITEERRNAKVGARAGKKKKKKSHVKSPSLQGRAKDTY